jgi:putative phage-type endonuclease
MTDDLWGSAFASLALRAYQDLAVAVGLAASRVAPPTISAQVGDLVTPTGVLVLEHSAPRDVWLDKRREGIGSSDLPAVMQLSGYRTPQHVYYDKRGEIPHDDDEDMGDPARYGRLFEEPLAFDWARRNRTVVESVGVVAHREERWQMCSLDRLCTECPLDRSKHELCALEVKCRNAFVAKLWRQGPPDDVLAQVLWQILVTGLDHIHVVCLIGGNDYRQYTVRRSEHEKLVAYLDAEAARLWHDHIVPGVPPDLTGDEPPDAMLDLYERLHPKRRGSIDLDRDLDAQDNVTEYLRAHLDETDAKARKKAAYVKMVAALGEHQGAYLRDRVFYSIDWSNRSTCDLAMLRERHPQAYAECVTEGGSDRLYIPKHIREEFAQ